MEEEEFRLFSCDQEPTLDAAFDKKNCVHQISQLYQVETMTLKHGMFGIVFIWTQIELLWLKKLIH